MGYVMLRDTTAITNGCTFEEILPTFMCEDRKSRFQVARNLHEYATTLRKMADNLDAQAAELRTVSIRRCSSTAAVEEHRSSSRRLEVRPTEIDDADSPSSHVLHQDTVLLLGDLAATRIPPATHLPPGMKRTLDPAEYQHRDHHRGTRTKTA